MISILAQKRITIGNLYRRIVAEDKGGIDFFIPPEEIIVEDAEAVECLRPVTVFQPKDRIRKDIPAFVNRHHQHSQAVDRRDDADFDLVEEPQAVNSVPVVLDFLPCNPRPFPEAHLPQNNISFGLVIAEDGDIRHDKRRIRDRHRTNRNGVLSERGGPANSYQ